MQTIERRSRCTSPSTSYTLPWALLVASASAALTVACGTDTPTTNPESNPSFYIEGDTIPGTQVCADWSCREPNGFEFDQLYEEYLRGMQASLGKEPCYTMYGNLLGKLEAGKIFIGTNIRFAGREQVLGSWDGEDRNIYLWDGVFGSPGELRITSLHESSHDMGRLSEWQAEDEAQTCGMYH